METQTFFQAWFTALSREFSLETFFSLINLAAIGIIFLLLYGRLGALKAFFFAPLSWLLVRSAYATMVLTGESFFSIVMFIVVTVSFAVYMVYLLFISDTSGCNRV